MIRCAIALIASLSLSVAARAADLPTGTWIVNVTDKKGDLVITAVKDGKVTGSLLGTDFTGGTWDGKELKFQSGDHTYEAQLVSEPDSNKKGQTKYTLTGTQTVTRFNPNRAAAGGVHVVKTGGWYAQITAETPVAIGEIKAEVRGVLIQDGTNVYVSVKRQSKATSDVEETRIWVWKSEGEWKLLQKTLQPLYGKEVIVTAQLGQMKSKGASIPEGAMYFLGKFEPKLANPPK